MHKYHVEVFDPRTLLWKVVKKTNLLPEARKYARKGNLVRQIFDTETNRRVR